ncbi:MAG: hypothetical protein NT075_24960 [Chloroflexi bacterium]|nr:hypothetical protein [Chloroflexota bacterium]
MLPSAPIDQVLGSDEATAEWPAMPTETEIYILPDGRIVIADLPAELAPLLLELGEAEPYTRPAAETSPADDSRVTH